MIKADNIKTVTDLRQNTLAILKYIEESEEPVIVLQHSKPKGVVLSFDRYQRILEMLEDYLDIVEAEEVLENNKSKFVPVEKLWKDHKLAG